MTRTLQIWLFSAILFAAGLGLFTCANTFPYYYHPDEPVKVKQIQTGDWNFHHPMLMLSTARFVARASGDIANPQHVVEAGRWVSAGFAAAAVALLAAMMWLVAGRFAGIATGLLLVTNHQLFELAHYFKEDTALLFGLSAWLLGLALYAKRPQWTTAVLVGAGAALAVSGKYIGVFAPLLSLWFTPLYAKPGRRLVSIGAFFGAFLAVFALVNLPLLLHLNASEASFQREIGLAVGGQGGMTRSVPHAVYLNAFRDNIHFALWIFIGIALWAAWRKRRERTALDWLLLLFPVAYLALLSFSPKTNDRYFLPATALFLCAVAMGLNQLGMGLPTWRKAAPAFLALAVVLQLVGLPRHDLRSYYRAFRTDDRAELTAWLNEHHPSAIIAQDRRTLLPSGERVNLLANQPALQAKLFDAPLSKVADLAALRADGVTLVALCQDDFGCYDVKSLRPQRGTEEAYRKLGALYQSLRQGRTPLWKRGKSLVTYLHPGLEVYDLPADGK